MFYSYFITVCHLFVVKNERGGVDIRNRPRIPIPDEDPYSVAGTSSYIQLLICTEPPWRNWLARSAVNRKVGGSSPPGGASFVRWPFFQKVKYIFFVFYLCCLIL
jgi:hypothetical protein